MIERSDLPYRTVEVRRVGRTPEGLAEDAAAVEEPLEVRLHGRPFAVIMRTPGHDRELAAGFLLAEGVVASADDIGAVERCRNPEEPHARNVVDVYLLGEAAQALPSVFERRRHVVASSSCGLCGRLTIESLDARARRVTLATAFEASLARALPSLLRERQHAFEDTGGLHGAGLIGADGRCEGSAEDVGRHNAVDKVVGAMLLEERLPLTGRALVVSGRASFEIVQKAWIAGIELVCAVSAPSTLAIDLAAHAGITLLGFARDGGFNVYSHPDRINFQPEAAG
jgi:FdhD protein